MYLSQMVACFADHHIWHTGTWVRGEHSAVYPAILLCSRSQIVKIIADQRKMMLLAIMLKFKRGY